MEKLNFNLCHCYHLNRVLYRTQDDRSIFYVAFDEVENREVGIKSICVSPGELKAVKSEALILNNLSNICNSVPSLYQTYYDKKNKRFYLIMQLINGRTLEEKMVNRLSIDECVNTMIKLCDAIAPLHQQGYQHRDLKPANIMMNNRGDLYIIDFNLTPRLPFKGEGTEYYRAPEQSENVRGVPTKDNVDVFAIGSIFYEMVTKEKPNWIPYKKGPSAGYSKFVSPVEVSPTIPSKVNDLIIKCMDIDPQKRPPVGKLKSELKSLKRFL